MQNAGTLPQGATVAPKKKRYRHTIWWYFKWVFNLAALAIFCATIAGIAIAKGLYDEMGKMVPDTRFAQNRNKAEATIFYASDGKTKLATFRAEQRKFVALESLKVNKKVNGKTVRAMGNLINATVAIEDSRFFTHPGVDARRVTKAVLLYATEGSKEQGGSTITEQLAKNIYQSRAKTVERRVQTMLLGLQLERRLTKEEILELYLNTIEYGNMTSGCEAAAQTYFGKPAAKLTIAEAALLAGLPQLPSRLDPFRYFNRAQKRQRVVLREMLQTKRITYAQYKQARADTDVSRVLYAQKQKIYAARRKRQEWRAPYFVSYAVSYLKKQYGWNDEFLSRAGLKVYTTVNLKMQDDAERILTRQLERLPARRNSYLQGALVSIDPWTGNVMAMVGGRDYYDSERNGEFNRAFQARRQPGSTFKPYVYAAAMEAGYTPSSMVVDSPLRLCGDGACTPEQLRRQRRRRGKVGHEIKNYTFRHDGPMTFERALAVSNNVGATRVLLKMGIQTVIEKAHLMGIQSSLVPVPTLALGVSEVTPLEHTSAYGPFVTGGLHVDATPILRVENPSGQVLVEAPRPAIGARVLSPQAAKSMRSMLRSVVTSGTGKPAAIRGVEAIGKTGTTSSNKDVWFMGASPQLVTGVWIGYDRPQDLRFNSAGGAWCAPVWRNFMINAIQEYNRHHPAQRMVEDARASDLQLLRAKQFKKIMRVKICDVSGLLANSACEESHVVVFSAGEDGGPPTRICDLHTPQTAPERPLETDAPLTSPGDLDYDSSRDPAMRPDTGAGDANSSSDSTIPTGDEIDPAQGVSSGNPDTGRDSTSTVPAPEPDAGSDGSNYDPDAPVVLDGQATTEADNPLNGG